MSRERKTAVIAGALGGLWALAGLMMPGRTPFFAWLAPIGAVVAGAVAAIDASRRRGRELDVDEAASAGAIAGVCGGFVVAVPFPLAVSLYNVPSPAGVTASIGIAVVIILAFIALSTIAAVIAARFAGPRDRT